MKNSDTIPSLYGLRALSIALVILSHVFLHARPHDGTSRVLLALAGNGTIGVSIFFVISGFIITLLLLRERERSGRISLSEFYVRRIFRILPAFLLYVGTIFVLTKASIIDVPATQFLRALTFTMDYVTTKNWFLAHVWSLSVEEQFYLIWPLLVVLYSRRVLAWIATSLIVLGPVLRMLDRALLPSTRFEIEYMGHTRADLLMFGCLIALWFEHERLARVLKKTDALCVPLFSAAFLFVISPLIELRFGGVYIKTIGYTLQGISIAFVMLYLIFRPRGFWGRIMNSKVIVHIGFISYGLYLWQQLFIGFRQFGFISALIRIAAAVVLAELSYLLVEHPMLQLRRRLSHRKPPVYAVSDSAPSQAIADA